MGLLEFTFPVVRHHQLLLIFITGTSMNIEQAVVFLPLILGFQQTLRICVNSPAYFLGQQPDLPYFFHPELRASYVDAQEVQQFPNEMIKDYTGPCSSDTCLWLSIIRALTGRQYQHLQSQPHPEPNLKKAWLWKRVSLLPNHSHICPRRNLPNVCIRSSVNDLHGSIVVAWTMEL